LEGSLVAVGANETVVPASEFQEAMRRIKQLEGALGRKTLKLMMLTLKKSLPEWSKTEPLMAIGAFGPG
jgi:transposase